MKEEDIKNIINEISKFLYMNDIDTYKLYSDKNDINEFINFNIIEYFKSKCSKPHKINNLLENLKNIDITFIDYLIKYIEVILINYNDDLIDINYICNLESPEQIKNNIRLLKNKITNQHYTDLLNEFNNYRYNKKIEKKDIYNYNKIFDENAKITSFEYNDYYFIKLLFNLLINRYIRDIIINNILKDKIYSSSSILNIYYIEEILNYKINNKINILINKLKYYNYYRNEILPKKICYFALENFINKINKIIKRKKIITH